MTGDIKDHAAAPTVICRCEELTELDILRAWEAGYRTPEEIKRLLRLGMGPCQGRTCTPLLLSLIGRLASRPVAEIVPPQGRPPLKPTPLEMFARLEEATVKPTVTTPGGRSCP